MVQERTAASIEVTRFYQNEITTPDDLWVPGMPTWTLQVRLRIVDITSKKGRTLDGEANGYLFRPTLRSALSEALNPLADCLEN